MRRTIFILFLFAGIILKLGAQDTDKNMEELINRSDWFALDEQFSKKKNMQWSDMQERLLEVMLNTHFNRPDAAINSLDTLLTYHQAELGLENVYNLIALKSRLYAEQGKYRDASENSAHFLNQLATFGMSKDGFPEHQFLEKYYADIAFVPEPEVVRPSYDVEIPCAIENTGNGQFIYLPVIVHGKTYRFAFDAGAGFTFISERLAQEMNLYMTEESIDTKGFLGGWGKSGIIDSMQIGDVVLKHIVVFAGKSSKETNVESQVDAVLGLDFLRLMGEIQLLPKKEVIIFPAKQTDLPKTGRNLMIENHQLYVKGYTGKERLVFHLDAGNTNISLHYPYYERNKEIIEKRGAKDNMIIEGISGTKRWDVYRLPQVALKIGKKKLKQKDVPVFTKELSEIRQKEDGTLGMDFFLPFKKVTFNTDNMFVEVE